jgi:2,4-dienoyl-CoA reductase-like NADH-dependent reductase (Old Yellow Enzyme family)
MMQHEKFNYKSLKAVSEKTTELGVTLPLSENLAALRQPLTVNGHTIANRLAIQPMEGCDGTLDGSPDKLGVRRYQRFAQSGAGLIWLEAVAILHEGRANPRQLMLTEKNVDDFKALVSMIKETSLKENGFAPVVIMQATHSGRYSKPNGRPEPIIAYHNPLFEKDKPIDDSRIVTDDHLKELEELYAKSAKLAQQSGFDGIDIKACHRYLISEMFSAYIRPGEYGGSFENRTRLFRNAISATTAAVSGSTFVTSRMNIYDGFPYPYGWGVDQSGGVTPNMSEPIKLVDILHRQLKINLLDFTIGNPYVNPHVNRPYDLGPYMPGEHPLESLARMCSCIAQVKSHFPYLTVISSGNSYLREFSCNMAAGMVESGKTDLAGFGRQAFAYPQFANDILKKCCMDPKKCCISCSKCSQLMRAGSVAGCVIRDNEVYGPIYKRDVLENPEDIAHKVSSM